MKPKHHPKPARPPPWDPQEKVPEPQGFARPTPRQSAILRNQRWRTFQPPRGALFNRHLQRDKFLLILDERRECFEVKRADSKKGTEFESIPWKEIQGQPGRLLGYMLSEISEGRNLIKYEEASKVVMPEDTSDHRQYRIRDIKLNLVNKTRKRLDDYLISVWGAQRYRIPKAFAYCWIRPDKEESLLFYRSP